MLIRARFVDALRETCLLVSFGMPLLSMVVLIHISWWHRITLHIRSAARVYRLVDCIINTMLVATFGEMKERERESSLVRLSRGRRKRHRPSRKGLRTSNSEAESSSAPAAVVEETAVSQPHNGRASAGDQSANGGDAGLGVGSFVGGSERIDCPICMEEYVDEDEVVLLPCRHLLHKDASCHGRTPAQGVAAGVNLRLARCARQAWCPKAHISMRTTRAATLRPAEAAVIEHRDGYDAHVQQEQCVSRVVDHIYSCNRYYYFLRHAIRVVANGSRRHVHVEQISMPGAALLSYVDAACQSRRARR